MIGTVGALWGRLLSADSNSMMMMMTNPKATLVLLLFFSLAEILNLPICYLLIVEHYQNNNDCWTLSKRFDSATNLIFKWSATIYLVVWLFSMQNNIYLQKIYKYSISQSSCHNTNSLSFEIKCVLCFYSPK